MIHSVTRKVAISFVIAFLAATPVFAEDLKAKDLWVMSAPGDRWHMTISDEERDQINRYRTEWSGATAGTMAFEQQAKGTVPLYRYMNPKSGDHFFTINHEEGLNAIKFFGYSDEGICCYVSPTNVNGTVPVIRMLKGSQHRYVFSNYERDQAVFEEGWKVEGIEGYVWRLSYSTPSAPTLPAQ